MIARRKTARPRGWCGRAHCAAAVLAGALAGCSGGGGPLDLDTDAPAIAGHATVALTPETSPPVAGGPVLAFIASGGDGQTAELDDPSFGGGVSVMIVRTYHAASDRLCRRFIVRNGRSAPSTRAACRNGSRWVAIPFAIP
jgi:hypothetical protein